MTTTIDRALGEFIDAWKAGRRPNVDDCLMRVAESDRDELAAALGGWLEIAPSPDYDQATMSAIAAEPPLVAARETVGLDELPVPGRLAALRGRAGVSLAELAARVVERLSVTAPDAQARTAGYLQELEADELDASRLSRRLLRGLAEALGARPGTLLGGAGPGGVAPGVVFQRSEDHAGDEFVQEIEALSDAAMTPAPEPMDDVDRLFLGGPEG